MVEVKIYIEGGGEGQLLDTLFRRGWSEFFKSAGLTGRMPRVVPGRGRQRTFDLFRTAVENGDSGTLPLLLVDSEEPVLASHTTWEHLKKHDNWDRPSNSTEDQAFLMVQVMETWFIADRGTLGSYFGSRFREDRLARWPDLESIPKGQILDVLHSATADCKTVYAKGRVSLELLASTNASEVERWCPHARQLLERLRSL